MAVIWESTGFYCHLHSQADGTVLCPQSFAWLTLNNSLYHV